MESAMLAGLGGLLFVTAVIAIILRILLRPNREPASRVAWVVIVLALPLAGMIAYLILGEVRVGRTHLLRSRRVHSEMPSPEVLVGKQAVPPNIPDRYATLFQLGQSISGYPPVSGNEVRLAANSNEAIAWMIRDIDAARDNVHLLFYIWLEDNNGRMMADAVVRAAERGVRCRVMVDGLGSRQFIRSNSWRAMREAGAELRVALPTGNLLLRPFRSRIDIRNHRKIVVIDGGITYCGSQNCADPEFRIKKRYAPWVDLVLRMEGPVAAQNLHVFAHDWITEGGKDMEHMLKNAGSRTPDGSTIGQVVATGPTYRNSAMPELFTALIYSARREVCITTPYYVPNQTIQDALRASAWRGITTTLILPARNDSRFVAAASRSHYADLLAAGVRIHEYPGGLLHSKTLVVDGELCLLGSANMDQRSFDLNYENNMLICDHGVARLVHERQRAYITASVPVTERTLSRWSPMRRLWNNVCAIISPVL